MCSPRRRSRHAIRAHGARDRRANPHVSCLRVRWRHVCTQVCIVALEHDFGMYRVVGDIQNSPDTCLKTVWVSRRRNRGFMHTLREHACFGMRGVAVSRGRLVNAAWLV